MESGSEFPQEEKYVFEEYFDLDGVKKKRYYTKEAWSKRQARTLMKKRVSKEGKPYVWRLGYNHCIGQWTGTDEYARFSGSSLNRSLRAKKKKTKLFLDEPAKVPYQEPHYFSKRSRGKVKDKATAFYRAAKREKVFVTLTFIEDIPDYKGVEILNKFLTVLRKEKAGLQYLWVAEHQEENRNTIHFHVIMNQRLTVKRYNALWVLQQYNAGLVGHRENGETISKKEIEERYKYDMTSKFKKKDADSVMAVLNPFDIEKCYGNISRLSYYLTEYITKQQDNDAFGCLNWHCSRKVSKLFTKELVSPSTFRYLCSFANAKVDFKTGEILGEAIPIVRQWFTMVYVNNKGAPLKRLGQMESINKWVLKDFDVGMLPVIDDVLYRKVIWKN